MSRTAEDIEGNQKGEVVLTSMAETRAGDGAFWKLVCEFLPTGIPCHWPPFS